jgi:hypothetical protein
MIRIFERIQAEMSMILDFKTIIWIFEANNRSIKLYFQIKQDEKQVNDPNFEFKANDKQAMTWILNVNQMQAEFLKRLPGFLKQKWTIVCILLKFWRKWNYQ